MLNYQKLTKAELIETLQSFQSARSKSEAERERLLHELQVHQIELEMQNQELRETQFQLEETGNLYADLYDFAPVGYISFDDKGCIREINLTGAALLGKERSFLLNLPFAAYVVPSDQGKFREHIWSCQETKQKVTTEIGLVSRDHQIFMVELSSVAVDDPRRQITLYRTVFFDITARKRLEEERRKIKDQLEIRVKERTADLTKVNLALQLEIAERQRAQQSLAAEKEQLSVTLFSIGDGVITTDTAGQIMLMNRVAESLTGWTQEAARGKSISEVCRILNEKTGAPHEDLVIRTFAANEVISPETDVTLLSGSGTASLITFSMAPIHDLQNNLLGTVLVFRDITNQRRVEKEFLKTQKLESLGILAGGIAHDFNNFLAGALANVQLSQIMLRQGKEIAPNLKKIELAIKNAAGLTKQLLTFAKGGEPVKKVVSLPDLIRDTVTFALRGSAAGCEFSIAPDLWQVEVDEGQINQVINNLIINADQAMPDGGIITVSAENVKRGAMADHLLIQPGDYVRIAVTDQGVGIPAENLLHIFDPYFTTKEKGSGLGLASSYAIIKKHHGYLDVASTPGAGSTFLIYLPVALEADLPATKEETMLAKGTGKILLMDDEESIRDNTGEMLSQLGYGVESAPDGAGAIILYTRALEFGVPFDVVIMDLTIPGGMGGKETIKKLMKIDPKVKAIVSSGYSTDPIMSNYDQYGFCGVVTKPYLIEELHEKLDRILHPKDEMMTPA